MKTILAASWLLVASIIIGCGPGEFDPIETKAAEHNASDPNITVINLGAYNGRHRIIKLKDDGKVYTIYNNYDSDNQSSVLLDVKAESESEN